MKPKTTLVLVLAALGLFIYIRFFDTARIGTKEAEYRARHLVSFERDEIETITIQNNQSTISLRKQADGWMMETPVKDRADSAAVTILLTTLETLRKQGAIDEASKGKLKEFGVGKSDLRLRLGGKNAPPEIVFGKETAVEGKVYVRLDGSKDIHVVDAELRNLIATGPENFRDHRLTNLAPARVTKALFSTATGEIELRKVHGDWELHRPIKARGDNAKIAQLLSQILSTRIESFVSDSRVNTGLAEPRVTATFFGEEGRDPAILRIGEPDANGNIHALIAERDTVCTLPRAILDLLQMTPNALRDQHLMRLSMDLVDRITIKTSTGLKFVLARTGDGWKLPGANTRPANSQLVAAFSEKLQKQTITAFVADVAPDLAPYGLDQPSLQVTFSSYASENTAESNAGEQEILTVCFGREENGNVFAKLTDEPFVVSVPIATLANIPTAGILWQSLEVFRLDPKSVIAVAIANEGAISAVSRGADGKWAATNSPGIAQPIQIESLLNTLCSLHAVRWIGTLSPDHKIGSVSIQFTTADNKQHKLSLGGETSDGMRFAVIDDSQEVFALSAPDVGALLLPIVSKPAAP